MRCVRHVRRVRRVRHGDSLCLSHRREAALQMSERDRQQTAANCVHQLDLHLRHSVAQWMARVRDGWLECQLDASQRAATVAALSRAAVALKSRSLECVRQQWRSVRGVDRTAAAQQMDLADSQQWLFQHELLLEMRRLLPPPLQAHLGVVSQ